MSAHTACRAAQSMLALQVAVLGASLGHAPESGVPLFCRF
jgi:hypothetical protein